MSRDDEDTATPAVDTAPTPDQAPEAPSTPEATQASSTDATASEATDGTQEQAPATPAGPTDEEIKALVDAFEKAAQAAVDSADPDRATITEEQVNLVKAAYTALPTGSTRNKARKWLDERMRAEIGEAHVVPARAFMTLEAEIRSAGGSPTVARPPVDPTQEHVNRTTALFISANFALPGPDVKDDWSTQVAQLAQSLTGEVQTYRNYLAELATWEADTRPTEVPEGTPEGTEVDLKGAAPAEPDVSEVVRNAARIARGRTSAAGRKPGPKASGTTTASAAPRVARSGERRDILAHIELFFKDKPVGTFAKYGLIASTDLPGSPALPSSGAVSARVKSNRWPHTDLVHAEEGGVQGIKKVS